MENIFLKSLVQFLAHSQLLVDIVDILLVGIINDIDNSNSSHSNHGFEENVE